MSLTAREWILLPEEEQEKRKEELSPHESFLLRTELDMIHFSEQEKKNMQEEHKYNFIHPKQTTPEKQNEFARKCNAIFEKMAEEAKQKSTNQK